jgi:hypothetical protein
VNTSPTLTPSECEMLVAILSEVFQCCNSKISKQIVEFLNVPIPCYFVPHLVHRVIEPSDLLASL